MALLGALKSKWDNGVNTKIVDDGRQVNSIKLITDIFDFELLLRLAVPVPRSMKLHQLFEKGYRL